MLLCRLAAVGRAAALALARVLALAAIVAGLAAAIAFAAVLAFTGMLVLRGALLRLLPVLAAFLLLSCVEADESCAMAAVEPARKPARAAPIISERTDFVMGVTSPFCYQFCGARTGRPQSRRPFGAPHCW